VLGSALAILIQLRYLYREDPGPLNTKPRATRIDDNIGDFCNVGARFPIEMQTMAPIGRENPNEIHPKR
jgi:hypothetical protein